MQQNPKLCIVTFYKNTNPGSILQAYALQEVLRESGCSVVFCRDKSKKHTVRYTLRAALLALIRTRRLAAARARIGDYREFSKAHQLLDTIAPKDIKKEDFDCFILGSDVIWDLKHTELRNNQRLFGFAFKDSKIISYAASAGNADISAFELEGFTHDSLNHIASISVRDQYTKDIVEKCTSGTVNITCDPTMLLLPEQFDVFVKPPPDIGRFIALYLFSPLSGEARAVLQTFAKQNGCRIVAMTKNETKYADIVTPSDPWHFLTYYKYADYIVTDTFHGSIFSVILGKEFVAIRRGQNKVVDLLEWLELGNRLVENTESVISVLERPIDWGGTRRVLSEMRTESLQFLREGIGSRE